MPSPGRIVLILLAAVLIVCVTPAAAWAQSSCPVPANKPASPGNELDPKIVLKPESSSEALNFGGNGGTRSFIVVLSTSRPLPGGFTGKQLELDAPKPFSRVSTTFDSATLPTPRFSHPQIIEHRHKVRFRVCVDASKSSAGVYSGQVNVSGPPGLSPVLVTATVNIKTDSTTFYFFVVVVLAGAFLLLLFKSAKEDKQVKKEWKKSLRRNLTDPTFVISTVIALGAAFFAMRAIYDKDPAWGADTWASILALGGAAFGAAGVGSVISAFTPGGGAAEREAAEKERAGDASTTSAAPGDECASCWCSWLTRCRKKAKSSSSTPANHS